MEFRMPDFFKWQGTFWRWRNMRKSIWRKRFALWPVQLGTHSNKRKTSQYVWLGFYYIKGTRCHYQVTGIGGIKYPEFYWAWHTVRTKEQRTIN